MIMHHIELLHNISISKVVLSNNNTYMFLFHTFIFALATAYLYKSYDRFLNKYKTVETSMKFGQIYHDPV